MELRSHWCALRKQMRNSLMATMTSATLAYNGTPTTKVVYQPSNITCENLSNGPVAAMHALQMGIHCPDEGGYLYRDFYFDCGETNYFHFLDETGKDDGIRYTCLDGWILQDEEDEGRLLTVPLVTMQTEWRHDGYLDDS